MKIAVFLFLFGFWLTAIARAEVSPDLRNQSISNFTPSSAATAGQFGGFAPSSATAVTGQGSQLPTNGTPHRSPTHGLTRSYFGLTFGGSVPRYFIADVIAQPFVEFTDAEGRTMGLRRQPIEPADGSFLFLTPNQALTDTPASFNQTQNIGQYLWSPHAERFVIDITSGPIPEEMVVAEGTAGAEKRSGFAFASRSGTFKLFWRSARPVTVTASNQPVYRVVQTDVGVSSGARSQVRRIFWTHSTFNGPAVPVPAGEIQQIRVAYTDRFPATVPDAQVYRDPNRPVDPDSQLPLENRTLWLDDSLNVLNAFNLEGRVLVEFLGEVRDANSQTRRQVGMEVVDIIREPVAASVDVPVGERLYPVDPEERARQAYQNPEGLPNDLNQRQASLTQIATGLAAYSPSQLTNPTSLAENFTGSFQVEGKTAFYAQKVTTSASDVQFFWLEDGVGGSKWPRFLNRYDQFWPTDLNDYALNLRSSDRLVSANTLPIFGSTTAVELLHQDSQVAQATLEGGSDFEVILDENDPVNRSLLLFRSGDRFWFLRVESVHDSAITRPRYAQYFSENDFDDDQEPLVALVGSRLTPPPAADSLAAWVDLSMGDAIDPTAYIDPFDKGISAAEKGAVIPVNAAAMKNGRANNQLGVWWFEKLTPPATAGDDIQPVFFPSHFTRYQLQWPTDAPTIVLASNRGSDDLEPLAASGTIYTQNDPTKVGYNPNEEHALLAAGRAYALRDDLNFPETTSAGYVLVRHEGTDGRPAMTPFRVFREDATYTFNYNAMAGTFLQPPAPLSFMPPPLLPDGTSKSREVTPSGIDNASSSPKLPTNFAASADYNKFVFEDRKGLKWIYRGPHNPTALSPTNRPSIKMEFFYKTREGFAFPNAITGVDAAPELGTIVPYLRARNANGFVGDPTGDEPLEISYTPYWPDEFPVVAERKEVPRLGFAETLVKAKFGLPSLKGATSLEVLYDQATARTQAPNPADPNFEPLQSALIHDPTRNKVSLLSTGGLAKIPTSLRTSTRNGRVFFQNLPPHLESNFYFDPNLGPGARPLGGLVLQGEFKDEIVGEDYILLNTLTDTDLAVLKNLPASNDTDLAAWQTAIDNLKTTVETFKENSSSPGSYIADPPRNLEYGPQALAQILNEDSAVDSYALTAVGGGSGYLTLLLGNGEAFTDASEPVEMRIIHIGDALSRGQVKPVTASNPLSEQQTLQHTADLAAKADDYEFQWFYTPPVNGQPPTNLPFETGTSWFRFGSDDAGTRITFGGTQPLLTLTDNYFVMRYRPKAGKAPAPLGTDRDQHWSQWTEPALAEGWIKRVLAGINPFNQRINDFFNNAVNTDVSVLTQAGMRWEGDVPLTLASASEAGLIEIYETLLNRAAAISIDGSPAIDYGPANDALLLAAGYLNDLYLALGNEAFADASNPLIALDVDPSRLLQQQGLSADIGTTIQNTATARFAFEGQVPNLISEELTLLRGRDDFLVPRARTAPVYNRFFWNFTRGIDAGEVIYAMNYNIRDKADATSDGIINAADAARQYPQGHGDAYGHYLTAVKNYYRLLTDPEFTWTPRVEAVNILGAPVTVDYQDERKLAAASVALGRSASRIIELERRQLPSTAVGWENLREAKNNTVTGITRHWGAEDWASRAGQGNYLHWVTINALLPEEDTQNEGLQKIDRESVVELDEMVALGAEIQGQLDAVNARSNALGLTDNSLLFDLDPSQLANGESHFDQILARAKAALANAATAHARTVSTNNLLRSVENQAADYSATVAQEEVALENRLLDIYGMPYRSDIGPGKTYPQGYAGPDFTHFNFVNRPYVFSRETLFVSGAENPAGTPEGATPPDIREFRLPLVNDNFVSLIAGFNNSTGSANNIRDRFPEFHAPSELVYKINLNDGPYLIANKERGVRNFYGSIQHSLQEVMAAEEALYVKLRSMRVAKSAFERTLNRFSTEVANSNEIVAKERAFKSLKLIADKALGAADLVINTLKSTDSVVTQTINGVTRSLPRMVGFSNDVAAPARGVLFGTLVGTKAGVSTANKVLETTKFLTELGFDIADIANSEAIRDLNRNSALLGTIASLRSDYFAMFASMREIDAANVAYQRALEEYQNRLVDGDTVLAERETFRKRAAAVIQGARVRDVGFRAFRTESLEQYKILFDQAARYTYLAAKAYDYETGLLGSPQGSDFLAKIVATRSLGLVDNGGEPQFAGASTGDPGLSSLLAQLEQDWNVAKGRLGINNPDQYGTLLSFRREHFEIASPEDGSGEKDEAWQDRLRAHIVGDLRSDPDIAAHALPFANPGRQPQPGIVIPFTSTITDGQNFFGKELRAGDSAYSSASFATRISSAGVVFDGYLGMDPFANGNPNGGRPNHSDPNALSATPYVYLIPAGLEHMRIPELGHGSGEAKIRSWRVLDHAMPLPFDIGARTSNQPAVWTSSSVLREPYFAPRRHQPFRAVDDPTLFYSAVPAEFTNSRLIGRSVWNDRWKLVIPAQTLLADPAEGLERFIASVRDIKLFLRTYSHAGN